ncbi:hypothetical protein HZU75_06845 [Chitinibacter fontanus]|uniref:Inhibitor I9 domain-containing protein n=1 Tax=Chitinibacter fontanus TaxID=1737446 RepID=A0A7D5Z5A4_9NEIS|nr:hypothetical protein [Chitinibacter fontanus]QLI81263.1 hypothetical protein HZU75_06845 [Chitinibacter fontanus]
MRQSSLRFTSLFALLGCCILSACVNATAGGKVAPSSPLIERVVISFKTAQTPADQAVSELAQRYQLGMAYERDLGSGFHTARLMPPQALVALQVKLEQISHDPIVASIEADLPMQTMPSP